MRSIIWSSNRSAPPLNAWTSRPRTLDFCVGRPRTPRWHGSIWLGWIRLLPSNPRRRPSAASRAKPSGSSRPLKTPSNTAMSAAGAARMIHCNEAEIGSRVRVERELEVGAEVVGPGDQRHPLSRAISAAASTPAAVSIMASTGFLTALAGWRLIRPDAARGTTTIAAPATAPRLRHRANAIRCRRRSPESRRASASRPRPPSTAPPPAAPLSSGFTASSRSSTTRSALVLARFRDRPRIGGRRGTETDRTQNNSAAQVAFPFRSARHRRIMP